MNDCTSVLHSSLDDLVNVEITTTFPRVGKESIAFFDLLINAMSSINLYFTGVKLDSMVCARNTNLN